MQEMLTEKDRAELVAEMAIAMPDTVPPVAEVVEAQSDTVILPDGMVPSEWVVLEFDKRKGHADDGSGRTKEQRSVYNKALYKELQDARTHHNAAAKRTMKEAKLQVVSGEVARRVREANASLDKPLDLDESVLAEVADTVLKALLKARG